MEPDPFTVLSRHGFFGELVAAINKNEDATMKAIGNDVLKAGLLAMPPSEIHLQSLKWVDERVVP